MSTIEANDWDSTPEVWVMVNGELVKPDEVLSGSIDNLSTVWSRLLTDWVSIGEIPFPLRWFQALTFNDEIFILGGFTDGMQHKKVYRTSLEEGRIGSWNEDTDLLFPLSHSQSLTTKDKIYLIGGMSNNEFINNVIFSPIGDTLHWMESYPLPEPVIYSQVITLGEKVYLLGGELRHTSITTIYSTTIDSDGYLGQWVKEGEIPHPLSQSQALITGKRVYLFGGMDNSRDNAVNCCYSCPIIDNQYLGEWIMEPPLSSNCRAHQAVNAEQRVYLIGGHDGLNTVNTVKTALINPDGSLSQWTLTSNLPKKLSGFQVIGYEGRIYVMGGYNNKEIYFSTYKNELKGDL